MSQLTARPWKISCVLGQKRSLSPMDLCLGGRKSWGSYVSYLFLSARWHEAPHCSWAPWGTFLFYFPSSSLGRSHFLPHWSYDTKSSDRCPWKKRKCWTQMHREGRVKTKKRPEWSSCKPRTAKGCQDHHRLKEILCWAPAKEAARPTP